MRWLRAALRDVWHEFIVWPLAFCCCLGAVLVLALLGRLPPLAGADPDPDAHVDREHTECLTVTCPLCGREDEAFSEAGVNWVFDRHLRDAHPLFLTGRR
jgi:hypothetical protein